jgi:hypothetical protein
MKIETTAALAAEMRRQDDGLHALWLDLPAVSPDVWLRFVDSKLGLEAERVAAVKEAPEADRAAFRQRMLEIAALTLRAFEATGA